MDVAFDAANIPDIRGIYRMGNNEFMHHCHLLALTDLVKQKLGITDEEWEVTMKEWVYTEGMQGLELAKVQRREALKQQLTRGINGKLPGQ